MAHMIRNNTIIRSLFFMKNEFSGQFNKYLEIPADVFVLDNEDSVPAMKKEDNRRRLAEIIPQIPEHLLTMVRINPISDPSGDWLKDVEQLGHRRLLGYVLSKVDHENEVREVDTLVTYFEKKNNIPEGSIKFIPNIETAKATGRVHEIALSSKRNVALVLGTYDLMAEVHTQYSRSDSIRFASLMMVLAARAAKIQAIYGPDIAIDSHSMFEKTSLHAHQCGFTGRVVLTKPQVYLANKSFRASFARIQLAKGFTDMKSKGIKTYRNNMAQSRIMIGPPIGKWAEDLLEEEANRSACEERENRLRQWKGGVVPVFPRSIASVGDYKVGESIKSPFQFTLDHSYRSAWEQCFVGTSNLNSSAEFAQKLGFKSNLVPTSLLLNLNLAMSVIKVTEPAIAHLGIYNSCQLAPVYYGDSVTNVCRILGVEKKGTDWDVVKTQHLLLKGDQIVFSVLKKTMFPTGMYRSTIETAQEETFENCLESHFNVENVGELLTTSQPLQPDSLFVHKYTKVFDSFEFGPLFSVLKVVNEHHGNVIRYHPEDILASGPVVTAATINNLLFDFGEILHSSIQGAASINKVNRGDMITSMSYVKNVEPFGTVNTGLEEVTLQTMGIKNMDPHDITGLCLPKALFSDSILKPREYEEICSTECLALFHSIVSVVNWKLIRGVCSS